MLARRAACIGDSQTSATRTKARALQKAGAAVINLAAGELDFDTSESIKQAAHRAIEAGPHLYTDGLGLVELREAIATVMSRETGVGYHYEECAVMAGAKQALFNTALMLFDPGDEVLIPAPCWGTFAAQIRLAGATPVFVDVTDTQYQLTADAVERHCTPRTKGLIVNSPNNPTGAVYRAEDLATIARFSLDRKLWVIFDRCYSKLVYPPAVHVDIVTLCPEIKPSAVIIDSLSKTYGLAGWRVGLLCGPRDLVRAVGRLQSHSTSNVSTISQRAALAAFTEDQTALLASTRATLDRRRSIVCALLEERGGDVAFAPPEGAFYVFLDVAGKLGKRFRGTPVKTVGDLADILLEHFQVAVVSGPAFMSTVGLRLSYVVEDATLREGVTRVLKCLGEIA